MREMLSTTREMRRSPIGEDDVPTRGMRRCLIGGMLSTTKLVRRSPIEEDAAHH